MKKADTRIQTIIGKGTVLEGDFTAESSVRLDGCIEGNVKVSGTLILGAAGKIHGDLEASTAVIGGEVLGDVTVTEKIEITSTARVIGNLKTNVVVIDEKAIFQGNCNMNQDQAESAKPRKRPGKETRAGRKSAKDALKEALKEVEEEALAQDEDSVAASSSSMTAEGYRDDIQA